MLKAEACIPIAAMSFGNVPHSSGELSKMLHWLCYGDSTVNRRVSPAHLNVERAVTCLLKYSTINSILQCGTEIYPLGSYTKASWYYIAIFVPAK